MQDFRTKRKGTWIERVFYRVMWLRANHVYFGVGVVSFRMARDYPKTPNFTKSTAYPSRMFINVGWLLWSPLAAASLHVFEEFAWPGGFSRWYRTYRGNAESVNRRFLFIINAGLLITLFEGAIAGRTPVGVALLLMFSAILFSNGFWHLWAGYQSHSYSPGVISGTLVYLPLGIFEYSGWIRLGRASLGTAAMAFLIGSSYPLWSAAYHRRAQKRAKHDSK